MSDYQTLDHDSESESLLPGPNTENENAPLLGSSRSGRIPEPQNCFPDLLDYTQLVKNVEIAITRGQMPERIIQGSSGSYFVKNIDGDIVGVFKPKCEEPYGPQNPKWGKYIQRMMCPCAFGRTCLLSNQGYLSETGASIVDKMLGLDMVPVTRVVHLTAESFNYSAIDRAKSKTKTATAERIPKLGKKFNRLGLPPKTGSLQTFVSGYKDAEYWLRRWDDTISETAKSEFQLQFERLVVLDYLIRNTDRGSENWLIKYSPELESDSGESVNDEWSVVKPAQVKIAAIDNGLAFPVKHPDSWRAYPYHWAWLSQAQKPFSEDTIQLVLHKVNNPGFIEELVEELKDVFKMDSDFSEKKFEKQMSVLRGQALNLSQAMRERKSPAQLVQMTPITINKSPATSIGGRIRSATQHFTQKFQLTRPVFSWC
ncbi:unnamed protein product [Oikopleura dioica]|uniref:Phosphatidylinositol 4-kinase type 2 n=1 Tax=Oikopleura dioica TaxID=34765 RepID=E4XCD3_OIKDI|nr:unnamed protein product [Oikopleura dioica]